MAFYVNVEVKPSDMVQALIPRYGEDTTRKDRIRAHVDYFTAKPQAWCKENDIPTAIVYPDEGEVKAYFRNTSAMPITFRFDSERDASLFKLFCT